MPALGCTVASVRPWGLVFSIDTFSSLSINIYIYIYTKPVMHGCMVRTQPITSSQVVDQFNNLAECRPSFPLEYYFGVTLW